MDEVHVERLTEEYGRQQEDMNHHPLLVLLKKWPSRVQHSKAKLLEKQVRTDGENM